MLKIGDTVRFLNAVGGGVITKIDEKNNMVYIEDQDGFEIPTMIRDCVAVPLVNEKTNFPKKDFSTKNTSESPVEISNGISTNNIVVPKPVEPIIETETGDIASINLAFIPVDIKQLQTTTYTCHLVNESNYFLFYNIVSLQGEQAETLANGTIEPNTQEEICTLNKDDLNKWQEIGIQVLPYKLNKTYNFQNAIDVRTKINVVKFYKLHSFTENDYFDEDAMMLDITTTKEKSMLEQVSAADIKQQLFQKENNERPRIIKKAQLPEIIEVDLHIHELIDNNAGMSNAEMLQLQLDKFHSVLAEHKNRKGQKIVFIHGKGEGVLRSEIEKQLRNRYKPYSFQDASFSEYGFGATMVTIK
jgi:DNA-nicking Smr family endonuclease